MPGRITELSETQIIADLLRDHRRQAAAQTLVQMPQPAKDSFTVASTPATTYQLNAIPYQGSGGSSLNLSLNGVELVEGVDYTCDYTTAIVTVSATLKGTPTPADVLTADYWTTGDLIAATGPLLTGAIFDNFNRADQAPPGTTSDGNATWSDVGVKGHAGVISNKMQWSASDPLNVGLSYRLCAVETNRYNGSLSLVCNTTVGSGNGIGPAFRISDQNNFLYAKVNDQNGVVDVFKMVAGSSTQISPAFPNEPVAHAGDTITIVLSGSSITVKVNGSTVTNGGPYTETFNQTATQMGVYNESNTNTADDFSWTPS